MVAPSLSVAKDERHNLQTLGISMIEETLSAAKKKLTDAIDQAQQELSELESTRTSRASRVEETEAALTEKRATEQVKTTALNEAKEALQAAEAALATARDVQIKGDEPVAKLREEKAALETVFQDHFKTPMQANEGPHYSFLQPYIVKLELEESLAIALPSSCAKAKEQRGAFDDLVISELEKAVIAKIESLAKSIAEEEPAEAERKAAVVAAETSLNASVETQKAAATELEAARAATIEAEGVMTQAKAEEAAMAPSIRQATSKHGDCTLELKNFEDGPMETFTKLSNKVAAPKEEAASAGA